MSRKTLLVVLFVSLAVNLFVIGAVAGGLVVGGRLHEVRAQGRPGPALWMAGDALPPGERRAYRRLLREEGLAMRPALRQARELRREAWGRMGQEPFDAAAARADLERARRLEIEARGRVEARILDFAGTLPAAERASLAEGLARARGGRGREAMRMGRGGPEGGPPGDAP